MVKLHFDMNKCYLPNDPDLDRPSQCMICLDSCPHSLILFRPLGMRRKKDGPPPERYKIHLTMKEYAKKFCPECLKCVEVCPSDALRITF